MVGYGKFFGIIGILVAFMAVFELIGLQQILPGSRLGSWDLFVGLSALFVSGFSFGTAWFTRVSGQDYIERGQSGLHWAKAIVISTEIVAGLIIVLWATVYDPNMLRDMLSGF